MLLHLPKPLFGENRLKQKKIITSFKTPFSLTKAWPIRSENRRLRQETPKSNREMGG
jgi:hypothetical protein